MSLRRAARVIALGAFACGGDRPAARPAEEPLPPPPQPVAAAPAPQQVMLRGMVRLLPFLSFQPCDGGPRATVLDSTSDRLVPAYRVLNANDANGMYVEAAGVVLRTQEVVLQQLEFGALPKGNECAQAYDFLIRATGSRPRWKLLVRTSGIELEQGEPPTSLLFPAVAPDDSAGMIRYHAVAAGAQVLHLLLTRRPCTEDSTANYGSMQALATVDGKTLRGCAAHGKAGQ